MSTITLNKTAAPAAPTSEKAKIYVNSEGKLSTVTSGGAEVYDTTDHSAVSITGTDGLVGGGDITVSRQISMPDVGTPGTYGSSTSFAVVTTDDKGRVTSASSTSVDSALPSVGTAGTYGSATSFPVVTTDAKGRVSGVSTSTVESALPNVITAGTYGNISSFPIVTVDAKGRVTGVTTSPLAGNVTAKTTGDVTNSSNVTNTALPELTLDLLPNTTYQISVQLIYQTANAGNGISMTFGAGSVVATGIVGYIETATSPTSIQNLTYNSLTTQSTFGTGAATNADRLIYGVTVLTTGASGGTFIPAFRSEGNGTVVTMRRNSKVTLEVL